MAKSGFTKIPSADAVSKYLGKSNIEVGILRNAPAYPDGTSVVKVANYLEHGGDGGNPPAYHWLRRSMGKDADFYKKQIIQVLKKVNSARESMMHALGRKAVDKIQTHIEKNDIGMKSNAPSTQRRKGGNSPMIDTQHLIRSIDYRVD